MGEIDIFSFFFSSRRRHTRWPRDWSSDVCSSDLIFQGFLGIYGGLIVLFCGFHITRFLLTKGKQMVFLYVAIFIYVAIYNLTLTHGMTILFDDPLMYLYIFVPTIIIPLIFTIIYQREYLRDELF